MIMSYISSMEVKNEMVVESRNQRKMSFDCEAGMNASNWEEGLFEFLNSETRNKKNCENAVRAVLQKANIVLLYLMNNE